MIFVHPKSAQRALRSYQLVRRIEIILLIVIYLHFATCKVRYKFILFKYWYSEWYLLSDGCSVKSSDFNTTTSIIIKYVSIINFKYIYIFKSDIFQTFLNYKSRQTDTIIYIFYMQPYRGVCSG